MNHPIPALGQTPIRWSWTQTIPAATVPLSSVSIFDGVELAGPWGGLLLTVSNLGSQSVEVTTVCRWSRSSRTVVFHLGPGVQRQMEVYGIASMSVVNEDGANQATIDATIQADAPTVATLPDFDWSGSLPDAEGAPGPWVNVGPTGYAPTERHDLYIWPSTNVGDSIPGVELRLLDPAGGLAAQFIITNAHRLRHPPRHQLQARHPGGTGLDPRPLTASWWRA